MSDIRVQRGRVDVASGGSTAAPGITFGSLASTFVRNNNNRKQSGGANGNSGTITANNLGVGVDLTATNTITFDRIGGTAGTARVDWEAWEYVGSAGGPNEFIVRDRVQVTLAGSTGTAAITGVTDADACIPFITGIGNTVNDADASTAIAYLTNATTLNVERGGGTGGSTTVYITVVEFTGANWQVAHGRTEGNGADSGVINLVNGADGTTGGAADIVDWATAVIYHQQKANDLVGVDDSISDTSAEFQPSGSTSSVNYTFDANHVDSASAGSREDLVVHVLRNPFVSVTRFTDAQSAANAMNVGVGGAGLTDLTASSVVVSRRSSGSGTAYARGWVNARLTSTSNVELWVHRSGNSILTAIQVINLASLANIGIASVGVNDVLLDGATNVPITGFGFEAVQGAGTIEIGDGPTYPPTTLVSQTVGSWSDTALTFDFVSGALSEGLVYIFVTNNSGDRASRQIRFGIAPYDEVVSSLSPDHLWSLNGDYLDTGFSVENRPMTQGVVNGGGAFAATPICEANTNSWELSAVNQGRECADANDINLEIETARTMGGWIRLGQVQRTVACLYKEGGNVNNLAFITGAGNILMAQLADTGDDNVQAYSDFRLTENRPYHILFRFDYNESPANFQLLIDGVRQTVTSGNPLTAPDFDQHSGDVGWGVPDLPLEVGGTDVTFGGPENCLYAQWATWTRGLTDTEMLQLFQRGARPTDSLSGTEAVMQTALDALSNTTRANEPLGIRLAAPTDNSAPTFTFDGIVFDAATSIQVEWRGTGVLTLLNRNGSNLDAAKIFLSGNGSVTIVEDVRVGVTGIADGTEVRIYEAGTGNQLAGVENSTGGQFIATLSSSVATAVDIVVVALAFENIRLANLDLTSGDVIVPVTQQVDRTYDNP